MKRPSGTGRTHRLITTTITRTFKRISKEGAASAYRMGGKVRINDNCVGVRAYWVMDRVSKLLGSE